MTEQPVLGVPSAKEIRDELQQLVLNDLLGPLDGPEEELSGGESPIDRYLLGRLAPKDVAIEPEQQDDFSRVDAGDAVEPDPQPTAPNVVSLTPSALGFTAHVDGKATKLLVTAKWGRYERGTSEREETAGKQVWRREQMEGSVVVPLTPGLIPRLSPSSDQPDVVVRGRVRRQDGNWLVSLFLDNEQSQPERRRHVPSWLFQVELSAVGEDARPVFLPRHERPRNIDSADQAERRRLAMAYRFHPEFAFGSGTAVHAVADPSDPMRATKINTSTVPEYEVPHTGVPTVDDDPDLPELGDVELGMKRLSELADRSAESLVAVLRPLVVGYRAWIDRKATAIGDSDQYLCDYLEEARESLVAAGRAADRIEAGIDVLASDDCARRAFGFANRAMYLQRLHTQVAARRRKDQTADFDRTVSLVDQNTTQEWRPFQLAFILLNLASLADPAHPERSTEDTAVADLLWFPTGGGKTEAYLGLTAFTLAIRRLQPQYGTLNAMAGVAVLMRYTLRLLTIQQFERATTLICAAEILRREDEQTWGDTPFRIGMWVGARVTPNSTKKAEDWLKQRRNIRGSVTRAQGSPHQLSSCPWCGSRIEPGRDIEVNNIYRRTLVTCPGLSCPFGTLAAANDGPGREERRGLPVLVVDEEIYRHPPALLIGTVDKFAQLPWRGETTTLFGRVSRRCERHGLVTDDLWNNDGWDEKERHGPLPEAPASQIVGIAALRPPDLIIQDELHLISGPLGSLVGLYECAVDELATWVNPDTRRKVRPKVIASTATVRRADRQIGSLFDRKTEIFPPPGLTVDDNFFARQRDVSSQPGRRYVGICAQGTRIKSTLIRVYVSVLGAAQKLHERYGRNEITDPYMTLVGYFNSLRDLGGMRRIAEDDVRSRLKRAAERGLATRYVSDDGIRELTSRLSSDEIRPLLDRLEVEFPRSKDKGAPSPIDVLLATNMIAVGVDVSRLGMMVVCGQPKSAAEYIQATSRVGRSSPGLIFTVYNWARPRDLSHYESFEHFHATVYRHVEALSVTPFADRAVDRGLTGVLVSLIRESELAYNGNRSAEDFDSTSKLAAYVARYLRQRSRSTTDDDAERRVEKALDERLAYWNRERLTPGRRLAYEQPSRSDDIVGLLQPPTGGSWRLATCPRSLRDVEPGVQLLLQPPGGVAADTPPPFAARVPAAETEPEGSDS
ncbi:DISARM system helicase DrmA [Amycolatopsis sp. NPDC057786]|uniref:DISARM system helicase DrmA n=1 Tax=Amycolatopsis sp. NPDC057786 TaxID=3346250 RepID=UPI003672D3CC